MRCNEVIKSSNIKFGTSGARGLVDNFSAEVCAAFTTAFLEVIKSKFDFNKVAVGIDNRPSSIKIASYVCDVLAGLGYEAVYFGVLPTPALAFTSIGNSIPGIMVTGSHIPFDRNGLKFYTPDGEITKDDEIEILSVSNELNIVPRDISLSVDSDAINSYIKRYTSILKKDVFDNKKIGIYEHSSAGRDIYRLIFESLGAAVTSLGRSDRFVPIDTEAVSEDDKLLAKMWAKKHNFDMIFSTDGDGDRPLIADENGDWLRGDVLGLITAKWLKLMSISVPVNCTSAIEKSDCFKSVVRTKIGSPFVISAFEKMALSQIGGFEANGGFILGADCTIEGKTLKMLPTRDAMLPAIAVLCSNLSISEQVNSLPKIYTLSDRIKGIDACLGASIIKQVKNAPTEILNKLGMGGVFIIDQCQMDGLRLTLSNQYVIHLRPSGNAPEFRIYVEGDNESNTESLLVNVVRYINANI